MTVGQGMRFRMPDKTFACSRIRENSEVFLNSHECSYGFVRGSYSDMMLGLHQNAGKIEDPGFEFCDLSFAERTMTMWCTEG